jgi:endoglucanase
MKRSILLLAVLAAGVLAGCIAGAKAPEAPAGFVTVRGKEIIGPDGQPLLLRGTNLGNWMVPEGYMFKFEKAVAPWQIRQVVKELLGTEAALDFWRRYYDAYITQDDLRAIRAHGMNTVRVPFDYRLFTPEEHPDVWTGPGFELMDRVIRWSAAEGLYVMLDLHAAPCGQTGDNIDNSYGGYPYLFEDEACQARTAEVWRRIAERYRDEPAVIGYDLLNEPIPHFDEVKHLNPLLEPLYHRLAAAVRAVDPNHLLFLGGAQWDSNFGVFQNPRFDDKVVYTFHKYWTAPTEEVIAEYVDFRDRHDVPIFMGESGENRDGWVDTFRVTLDRHRIGWTFWPYKKMDAVSSPRTFDRPPYWDEIVAYQELFGTSFADKRKARPPREHVRAAFDGLIENARFANSRPNPGYLRALGLQP